MVSNDDTAKESSARILFKIRKITKYEIVNMTLCKTGCIAAN